MDDSYERWTDRLSPCGSSCPSWDCVSEVTANGRLLVALSTPSEITDVFYVCIRRSIQVILVPITCPVKAYGTRVRDSEFPPVVILHFPLL
ncbi:hypothetical protein EVAR_62982_1 [Eumeta japonica]|uniref:Uncharacterized protein n=1 Tax=Eumeta variegata TaxID=151549 RepID=A0A4C1ZDE3_EUMVA|nr:hypothetical protein EVAR_62982_1 [Eumeta japonica]